MGWWGLRNRRRRARVLAVMSYVFYAYWDWRFVPLMLAVDRHRLPGRRAIARTDDGRRARRYLIVALIGNLALLGYFKYAGFFLDSRRARLAPSALGTDFPSLHVVLPIGISFYTFNSMSYTIDVYRGVCSRRELRALRGVRLDVPAPDRRADRPLHRHRAAARAARSPGSTPELAAPGSSSSPAASGRSCCSPTSSRRTSTGCSQPRATCGLHRPAWPAALGYSLQLYFDFSGYSDMAVGLALPARLPASRRTSTRRTRRVNISDFWRRWHMSLSFWLRDYLFIPLGGSRGGRGADAAQPR